MRKTNSKNYLVEVFAKIFERVVSGTLVSLVGASNLLKMITFRTWTNLNCGNLYAQLARHL